MTDLLPPWRERHPDYANLFNPAFVGLLLRAICEGYVDKGGAGPRRFGLPFPLSFIAVPLALSPDVRRKRPKSTRTRLAVWSHEHLSVRAELVHVTRSFTPVVRESIVVMVRAGLIAVDGARLRSAGTLSNPSQAMAATSKFDLTANSLHAKFVGRWLRPVRP